MSCTINASTTTGLVETADLSGSLQLQTNSGTTAVTIDTSQNVGIGTASPSSKLHVTSTITSVGDANANFLNGYANSGDTYSQLSFWNNAGSNNNGQIGIEKVGTNGGLMYFKSKPDGGALAERMRIASNGDVLIGKTSANSNAGGFEFRATNIGIFSRSGDAPLYVNRITNDGTLVLFGQDDTVEGNISVSGTTVSYNGGHLSRWSQLLDGSKDDTILKGTVMSNLDDMCVWEKDGVVAENEQLNKMKISDVEGDTNVAGVFVNWTVDEKYGVDDMNVAMTGDMIIRIADGVAVQKGDLLMSAGDGTAKPQGDDIHKSKTIAKVTSNYVTCTYEDGSYCVPCVLMAC
jgi:hypothetical protein